ncbi:MAG: PASTA domain-containing protein [Gemmatimonadetes bacterium]|nr:PASTA domain-containing protein [Gemmatimonadota bacterium]
MSLGAERLKRALPWLGTLAGGFVLAFLAVWLWIGRGNDATSEAKVPNVVGLKRDQALAELTAAGFTVRPADMQFHPTAPEGTVLQQTPTAGTRVMRGSGVTLAVSAGQRRASVPEVVGKSVEGATAALQAAGFDVGDVIEQPAANPRGEVIFSTPSAGTTVVLPASVSLVIASGVAGVRLPDFSGRSLEDAKAAIAALGLELGVVVVDSASTRAPGTVLQQIPSAGDFVAGGSAISLTVARRIP